MKKFKVGDKVRIKKRALQFFVTEEALNGHVPPRRPMNKEENKQLDTELMVVMTLLMDNSHPATVLELSHEGTNFENYNVEVLGWEVRIQTKDLYKYV